MLCPNPAGSALRTTVICAVVMNPVTIDRWEARIEENAAATGMSYCVEDDERISNMTKTATKKRQRI